ncbi:MAG: SDR family NAD(P)-dependent oxidoreductase, partial [Rhodospirillales bacterium]|nr:SDR family NAD(P)-dependent oxidoreductase [Rhodospirillales bacterium]
QFEVNVIGTHDLTRRLIPSMRKNGSGRIVNCSSVLGLVVAPYRGAYCASKFALEALTASLRLELEGSGISVSLIEPGPVVLVTTHDGHVPNVMTISWMMVLDFSPRFAMTTGAWNHSYAALTQTKACVIAVPTIDLLDTVVGVGTCSGADTDKFRKFGLTPVKARHVQANQTAARLFRMPAGANPSLSAPEDERPEHFQVLREGVVLPAHLQPMQRAARGEHVPAEELEIRFQDETGLFLLVQARPILRPDGSVAEETRSFDMLHVVPPQVAPDIVRASPFADAAGWVDVSPETLRHPRFGNVFSLGDACSAPNAKTAAAIRKQAFIMAFSDTFFLLGAALVIALVACLLL